jgi:hypothetical protein
MILGGRHWSWRCRLVHVRCGDDATGRGRAGSTSSRRCSGGRRVGVAARAWLIASASSRSSSGNSSRSRRARFALFDSYGGRAEIRSAAVGARTGRVNPSSNMSTTRTCSPTASHIEGVVTITTVRPVVSSASRLLIEEAVAGLRSFCRSASSRCFSWSEIAATGTERTFAVCRHR